MTPVYAVVGASGNVGRATALALRARGAPTRVVLRPARDDGPWRNQGIEAAVADLEDSRALARAFEGAASAFVLNPPAYGAPDLFERAVLLARSIREAARAARLPRLVVLSSMGAHLDDGTGIIATNHLFERLLGDAAPVVCFLRPSYFIENWRVAAASAAGEGILRSFLSPVPRAVPMISAADIGTTAAALMVQAAVPPRVVELTGPRSASPEDVAGAFARALDRPVVAVALPRPSWAGVLAGWGFTPVTVRAWSEMFDGFNSGRIAFEREGTVEHGHTTLDTAVSAWALRAGAVDRAPAGGRAGARATAC